MQNYRNDTKIIDDFIKQLEQMPTLKVRHKDVRPYVIATSLFSKEMEPVIDINLKKNIIKDLLYLRYEIEKLIPVLEDLEEIE